ncbi:MAG: hypothetical protein J5U17_07180 [Candidatus Methanoperedens sp.]|nr:hypothetical protein [Candidatus Methanoperedens sp.]MCE8427496.1 hypothetical protein [Candidatus Methanoperedens sp.]
MAKNNNGNGKTINSQAAMDKAVKSVCDILRRDKAKGARLYVPELTWMFFLRYLDIMEQNEEQKAKALGVSYTEMLKVNKQKVISEIFRNKEKTILSSETNLQNALDKIHNLSEASISDQHI